MGILIEETGETGQGPSREPPLRFWNFDSFSPNWGKRMITMDPITSMDLYGDESRKLSELSDELNEFLDSGTFTPTSSDSGCGLDTYGSGMDEDWLDSFFEDPS